MAPYPPSIRQAAGPRRPICLLMAGLSLIALGACGGGDATSAEASAGKGDATPSPTAAMSPAEEEVAAPTRRIGGFTANFYGTGRAGDGDRITINAGDDYFEPTVLMGRPGGRVTLAVKNTGDSLHSFTSEELGIDKDVDMGETITVSLTFPESGQVVFICRYHEFNGMVGGLKAR